MKFLHNKMKLFLIVYTLLQISSVISSENATTQNNSSLLTKTNVDLLKKQVNQIGIQAENFVIDLFSQLLNSTFNGQVTVNSTHFDENDENSTNTDILSRKRRDSRNMEILTEPLPPPLSPQCKPDAERKLERHQLADLQQEVDNLRDLILLLRDQQKIVDLLKRESKNSEHLLPKTDRENIKSDIINELKPKQNTFVQFGETHEELEKLKFDLKTLVASLNETRQVLANERTKERQLELELNRQREELSNLKILIGKLLGNSTEPIVGAPLKLPTLPQLPSIKPPSIEKKNVEKPQTRASSDSSDIRRILALIAKNEKKQESNGDILDKIKGLQDELENREKNEDLLKQLVVIERLLKQNTNENSETKTLDDDNISIKKLLSSLTTDKQSKTDDENLLSELRNLQTAINSLRPTNDGFDDLDSRNEQEQFQFMLNKLINGQSGRPRRLRPQRPTFFTPIDSTPYMAPPYAPLPYYNLPAYFPQKTYENSYQPQPETNQYDWGQFFQGQPTNPYNSQPYSSPYPTQLPSYPSTNSAYGKTKIDDLKTEIYELQNIIQNLNQPGYIQNPDDKQTVYNLETQINDLKNVIGSMTADSYQPPAVPIAPQPQPVPNYDPKASRSSRRKRSIDDNRVDSGEDNQQLEALTTMLQKVFPVNEENVQNKMENNDSKRASDSGMYGQIREQLNKIRNQLEPQQHMTNRASTGYGYNNNEYGYNNPAPAINLHPFHVEPIKEPPDHFVKIVLKIVDKILGVAPYVEQRLVNFLLNQLMNPNHISNVFHILPLIILRVIDTISSFINTLRYNKFVRTFLIPALVVLLVAGSIVFLIWFLQPPDYENYPTSNYKGIDYNYNGQYGSNNYNREGYDRREMVMKSDNREPQYYRTYFDRP